MKQLPTEYVNGRREYILFKNDVGVTTSARNGWIYEEYIYKYIKQHLDLKGTTVIDVGANFGFHTLEFAELVGDNGNVISFEPQKLIYYQLCGNVILNGFKNITTHNIALSDEETVLKMENLPYNSPIEINIGNAHLDRYTHIEYNLVPVNKLDNFVYDRISVIKIDIQGYEPKVLDGAQSTIKKFKPTIFIEIEEDQLKIYNYTVNDIFKKLDELGYTYQQLGVVDYVAFPK